MGLIFISCGQRDDRERNLGEEVARLVEELTPHEAYFAQRRQRLESVARDVLRNLGEAVGIIAILHRRDEVGSSFRASVWAEQEIAIATFRSVVLGDTLPVLAFAETGLALEGVRSTIILNAHAFDSDEEVLDRVRREVPAWSRLTASLRGARLVLASRLENDNGDTANYLFDPIIVNESPARLEGVHLRFTFPGDLVHSPGNARKGRDEWAGDVTPIPPRASARPIGLRFHVSRANRQATLARQVRASIFADGHEVVEMRTIEEIIATRPPLGSV